MAGSGIRITDKAPLEVVSEIVAIRREGTAAVGPIAVDSLAEQLVAGGPIKDEFEAANARIDLIESGENPKYDVAFATFSNVNLATDCEAGDTLNGVLLVAGMRFAPLGQSSGATITETTGPYPGRTNSPANGIYIVQASGAAVRSTDMDSGSEIVSAEFFVAGGTTGKGATFKCATTGPITVGVTGLLFVLTKNIDTTAPGALDALRGGGNIATASSINLTTATGDNLHLTGNTPINAVTLGENLERLTIADADVVVNVSTTLIGDNAGLPVQLRQNDVVLWRGYAGGVVHFRVLPYARPSYEIGAESVVIFATHDLLYRAGVAVMKSERGGFVLEANGAQMLSPEERVHESVVAWAAPMDRFNRTPLWVGHDGGLRFGDGVIFASGAGATVFTENDIAAYDSWALAYSAMVKANGNPNLQKLIPGKAHFALYGQSLSTDALGHWLRLTTPTHDGMMLGNSIYSSGAASSSFNPFGGSAVLNTLAGTMLNAAGNALIASSSDVAAAGGWMAALNGSDQAMGFADFAKHLFLQRASVASDSTRRFVMTSTGRGGRSLAELSKGTNFFARTVDGATKIKAADATAYLVGIGQNQGEQNVTEGTTYADFYNGTRQLWDDIYADIAVAVYGQSKQPAKILHQVSSRWVVDATNQQIQRAQEDLATNFPDVFLVGPSYQYPNKTEADAHLDANGYLWQGLDKAKVFDRVVYGGEGWQPLKIIKAVLRTNELLLLYNVPAPPIQLKAVLAGYALTTYANRGFKITNSANTVTYAIAGTPEVVGDAAIRIRLTTVPNGAVKVWYASQSTAGQGNVFDSDPTPSIFNWTYKPSDGDDAAVNVASLVDKPFSLNNAAIVQIVDSVAG